MLPRRVRAQPFRWHDAHVNAHTAAVLAVSRRLCLIPSRTASFAADLMGVFAGAWLVRVQDVVPESERAVDVAFDDSTLSICTPHANVKECKQRAIDATGAEAPRKCGEPLVLRRLETVASDHEVRAAPPCLQAAGRTPRAMCAARHATSSWGSSFTACAKSSPDSSRVSRIYSRRCCWTRRACARRSRGRPRARTLRGAVGRNAPQARRRWARRTPSARVPRPRMLWSQPARLPPAATVPTVSALWSSSAACLSCLGCGPSAQRVDSSRSSSLGSASRDEEDNDALDDALGDETDASERSDDDGAVQPTQIAIRLGSAPPMDARSAAMVAVPPLDPSEAPIGQICLGMRYLRLLDTHADRPADTLVPLLCRRCERTLSYTDQLLCTRRRWGFGRTHPQPACFMNSVVSAHVEVRGRYEEQLAQGLMEMADVWCKCGCQVGYKFCGDKTASKRNRNQVGRYGLVCSTFKIAPYQLAHPRVY